MMLLVILFIIKSQAQLNLFNPLLTDGTSTFYVMNSSAAICDVKVSLVSKELNMLVRKNVLNKIKSYSKLSDVTILLQ